MKHCGRCHTCGGRLSEVLDGEEWCVRCKAYRRYRSHGWAVGASSPADELITKCSAFFVASGIRLLEDFPMRKEDERWRQAFSAVAWARHEDAKSSLPAVLRDSRVWRYADAAVMKARLADARAALAAERQAREQAERRCAELERELERERNGAATLGRMADRACEQAHEQTAWAERLEARVAELKAEAKQLRRMAGEQWARAVRAESTLRSYVREEIDTLGRERAEALADIGRLRSLID